MVEYRYSAVAAVIDAGGGVRVVVDDVANMQGHIGPGEKLLVVPGYYLTEPVADVAGMIETVNAYIRGQQANQE